MKRLVQNAVATLCLLALPAGMVLYFQGVQERRDSLADTAVRICKDNQGDWDTLHAVIGNIGEPSPTGNAITRLFIPPETPEYVRIILAQLATPLTEEQKAEIRAPFYAKQGERPTCDLH